MFNPYALLAGGVLWLLSLAAVGVWQHQAGTNASEAAQLPGLKQAHAAQQRAALALLNKERIHASALDIVATDYERKMQNAKFKNDSLTADLRDARIRLRDPGSSSGCAPAATPGPGKPPSAEGRELSGAASSFLLGLTFEADNIARQLAACQQTIIEDRK